MLARRSLEADSEAGRPRTYGRCRNIILKHVDPDFEFESVYNEETDDFTPTRRVRDVVFRCKNCGAFNEVPDPA